MCSIGFLARSPTFLENEYSVAKTLLKPPPFIEKIEIDPPVVHGVKLPFLHFEGKDLSKFRRIPAEFRHLEEKARKRKGKETDRRFWNHSIRKITPPC